MKKFISIIALCCCLLPFIVGSVHAQTLTTPGDGGVNYSMGMWSMGAYGGGGCVCGEGTECICSIIHIYTRVIDPSVLASIKGHYTQATFTLSGTTFSVHFSDDFPRVKSPVLNQKAPIDLDPDSCRKFGYSSITVLPGTYNLKGNVLALNVKLGKKLVSRDTAK